MLQAAVFDGVALDAFSFCEDRLGPAEADIGWCEVVDALMITDVIVVFDEGPYPAFEIIGQAVIVERYAVLQRLMPASIFPWVWGWVRSAAHMQHAIVIEPRGQIVRHRNSNHCR